MNGTKYEANKKSAANIAGFASTVDKSKDVDVYLDAYGYGLYVDADTSVEYAVILAYEAAIPWTTAAPSCCLPTVRQKGC